jgi:glycosyltransferase involved in cell wall biosynthesis
VTRLAYIHNIAMPGPEANTVNVAKMCDAFAANGAAVTLIALPGCSENDLPDRLRDHYGLSHHFQVHALPAAARRPLVAGLVGAAIARRHGADVVYSRAPHAVLAACISGVDSVLEMHLPPDAFSPLGRAAYRAAVQHPRLAGVVAISRALAQRLKRDMPARTPVIVAHDGADQHPLPAPRTPGGRLSVGFVGRFYRGKGLELIAKIAPLCPWADFHVIGGDAEDAAKLIGEPPASNLVFHGVLPHASIAAQIANWDVALAPYQRAVIVADGKSDAAAWMSPLKLFEYMAAAKAILASNLPALREVVADQETAWLLPPDNALAWASALRALRDDPNRRANMGARAHDLFCARYTWRQRALHILQSMQRLPADSKEPQAA